MTLSLVGSTGGTAINGGNVTLTYPTTTRAGDVVYVWGGHGRVSATSTDLGPTLSASFTTLAICSAAISSNCNFGVWRRVLPAAEATVLCLGTTRSSDTVGYMTAVFRGVSTASPEGGVTPTVAGSTTANPDPPAITAPSGTNWVVAASGCLISDTAPGTVASSSGGTYTALSTISGADTIPFSAAAAYWTTVAPSASIDPGAWSAFLAGSNASITTIIHEATAQTLTATLLADADTFNTDTVTPGAVSITPALYSDTDSFGTATVVEPQSIYPHFYSDLDSVFSPRVYNDRITPPLYSDADSFGPDNTGIIGFPVGLTYTGVNTTTVAITVAGDQITPVLYSDTDSFGTASVTSVATVAPALYSDTDSFGTVAVTSLYYITASCYSELDIPPQFLLHADGQDGQQLFVDATGRHTVGFNQTAQLDTSQTKFGPSSLFLDGDQDYLILDGNSDFAFGTGDFTIDMWVRLPADWSVGGYLYDSRPDSTQGPPAIAINGSALLEYVVSGAVYITGSTPLAPNQWYHVAVTRSGSLVKLFLDGVSEGQAVDATNHGITANRPLIGGHGYTPTSDSHYGWIDEVRVVKGTAVWTANFTPPTSLYGLGIETVDAPDVSFIITPALYSDTDSFGTASISRIVTPVLYSDTDSFGIASVTSIATIAPALYSDTDSFGIASVGGIGTVAPTLYTDTDSFGTVTVTPGEVSITPTLYSDTDTFASGAILLAISPALFEDQDLFYAGPGYDMSVSGGTSTGDFTVSGRTTSDLFTHPGVIYPYAPVERRTN